MAGQARRLRVLAGQFVFCMPIVIECQRLPIFAQMTFIAHVIIKAAVFIIDSMTGIAVRGGFFIFLIRMATFTVNFFMTSLQCEFGFIVIKISLHPSKRSMTLPAIFPKFSLVYILLLVAIKAACSRLPPFCIFFMAALTLDPKMLSRQFKIAPVVFESVLIHQDYLGIAAFVIRMTIFTRLFWHIGRSAVETQFKLHIF
jgi:hypothetical protein